MKASRLLLVVSHAAALVAGLLLFRSFAPAGHETTASTKSAAPPTAAREAATHSSRPRVRTEQAPKTSVHLAAWKALASQGLARPERMKASALLLRGWIKEDWRAALDVVMKETPDDFALLNEFFDVFAREPEAVWQIIEEKRYGVLSQSLIGRWQSMLVLRDEASVRKLAETLPERGKQAALETLKMAKPGEPYSGGG